MCIITVETFSESYDYIIRMVRDNGMARSPRHHSTRDLGFTTICVTEPENDVLPLGSGRNISKTVAAIEALQLIGNIMKPDLLVKASSQFANYMEKDENEALSHFHGGYGERVGDQINYVIAKLKRDPDTRQAVVTLWDPHLDNITDKKDYPCTVGFQFQAYNYRLDMNVIMRSNDAWLGLPYDVFVFTQVQKTVARILNMDVGYYYHSAWSLHLYESDFHKVNNVSPASMVHNEQPNGLNVHDWHSAQVLARCLLDGDRLGVDDDDPNDSRYDWLRWYVNALAPVMG